MPELLIELFSGEIPARMQKRAEEDLARLFRERLAGEGLVPEGLKTFSTPRRIGLACALPARTEDVREERKGPRVGAPEQAVQGFLRGAGLNSVADAKIQEDPKGAFYVAVIEKSGRPTPEVIGDALPEIIRAFPWPKSMRSGAGDLRWVRPLQSILCAFDAKCVPMAIEGIESGLTTQGHRFLAPGPFEAARFDEYAIGLKSRFVILDREARKAAIVEQARAACANKRVALVEDAGLLEEVAGLVEWPVVIVGDMDPAFLDLPGEVIRLTMRTHQRYFAVRDPKSGRLAAHFVTVANVEAKDGGAEIARGNAKVLSARLNDARFFWDLDKKKGLEDAERLEKLKALVFHQKLGSVWDKVERVRALAAELCEATGADPKLVDRAALLMKADLVTETVGEFPELQGQIGRELAAGEHPSVAIAIEDHYRPLGPNDRTPTDPVAVTLALADKIDTLVGFWAIDEKPTGSSDPYALRRAALGVVRVVLANRIRFNSGVSFADLLDEGVRIKVEQELSPQFAEAEAYRARIRKIGGSKLVLLEDRRKNANLGFVFDPSTVPEHLPWTNDLLDFLADRLKIQLRDQGKRHDLLDAVFAIADDDLVRVVSRVEALEGFLKTEDGANLLAGYKRAANILAAEEKKGKGVGAGAIDPALWAEQAEMALHAALLAARPKVEGAIAGEDFAGAMSAFAALRAPLDAFFDSVLVNADDEMLRRNRLLLLAEIRDALGLVADFSKIGG